MKNKKLLYGILGIGAIAGLYFWNKNKKSKNVTPVVSDDTKQDLVSNGAKKIVKYLKEKYQDGKNPKYQHNDAKQFFEPRLDFGKVYIQLEDIVKKYSKNQNDTKSIIDIYLYQMSQQLGTNDFKLSDESSLFLAKNPDLKNEISGIKKSAIKTSNDLLKWTDLSKLQVYT